MENKEIDCLLRLPSVEKATGFKRSHIYSLESQGKFPKRVKLGIRTVGWRQSEVEEWIRSRATVDKA